MDSLSAPSPHTTTAQGGEILRTSYKGGTASTQWRILSVLLLKKLLATGSGSPPKAQCGLSWLWLPEVLTAWRDRAFRMLMRLKTAPRLLYRPPHPSEPPPSHHLWSPLSMHLKGWLQTDKYYIYNMNIYSNFNGLLFSYSFNLLYWFILVMRNNIMFCGFISSFFFFCWIIIIIIICCMVFMNTHSYKYTHSTNSSKQYVLFLLWGEWCLTLKCTFSAFW